MSASGFPGRRLESYRAGMMTTTVVEEEDPEEETVAVPWGATGCTANTNIRDADAPLAVR